MGRRHHTVIPRPTVHTRSGHARLRLGGKEFWLGPAGSKEADSRYAQLVAAWIASGGKSVELPAAPPPAAAEPAQAAIPAAPPVATATKPQAEPTLTIGRLLLRYLADIKGLKTPAELRECSTWWNVRLVANALETRRAVPVEAFGPKMLKDVQAELASRPRKQKRDGENVMRTRYMVNRITKEIVRMFAWAVSEELVGADQLRALECVRSLRAGETLARESDLRGPVADADLEAILPHLPPVVADLIQFARRTAVRPSEACRLRRADVDFSPELPAPKWTLGKHKNAHRGKIREIAIGPRALELVQRWSAGKSPTDPVFGVADLGRARVAGTIKKRKRRTSRSEFTTTDIRKDVAAACRAAGVPNWTPYQLRHAGIGEARQVGGLEAAQAHAGHASVKMTEHYARVTFDTAAKIALRIG